MAIITEYYVTCEDGVVLSRTYSDETETDEPIEEPLDMRGTT